MKKLCLCSADLDRRVSVRKLKSSLTLDASGHIDETSSDNWTEVGKHWCQFITKGSREFFRGEEVAAEITHQLTMRYSSSAAKYTTKMQIRMKTADLGMRTFNIAGPGRNLDEQDNWLVFPVTEIK